MAFRPKEGAGGTEKEEELRFNRMIQGPEPDPPTGARPMSQKLFEDLGFSPQEAAALKLKADLNTRIVKAATGYTQQELQNKLGTSQPRVSDLLRGKISKFSLDTLVVYAELLGLRTEIRTTQPKKYVRDVVVYRPKRSTSRRKALTA
jgi:predicted XRE-type DNA-binding protein